MNDNTSKAKGLPAATDRPFFIVPVKEQSTMNSKHVSGGLAGGFQREPVAAGAALLGVVDAVTQAEEDAAIRAGYLSHGTLHGAVVRRLARHDDARLGAAVRESWRATDLRFLRALLDAFDVPTIAALEPAQRQAFFNHLNSQCFPRAAVGSAK